MYMGRAGGIDLYKHIDTRRYLNADAQGNTFVYIGNGYEPEEGQRPSSMYSAEDKVHAGTAKA
jgi:hypothetical protein